MSAASVDHSPGRELVDHGLIADTVSLLDELAMLCHLRDHEHHKRTDCDTKDTLLMYRLVRQRLVDPCGNDCFGPAGHAEGCPMHCHCYG